MLGLDIPFLDEPVPNFYFAVKIIDVPSFSNPLSAAKSIASMASQMDPAASAFTEVSGLSLEIETKAENEACNSIEIPFPSGVKNDALVLKRYVRPRHIGVGGFSADPITGWCQDTFAAAKNWLTGIKPKDIIILIMHPHLKLPLLNSGAVAGYIAKNAYPVKWDIDSLNSTDNQPLQETIEFKYRELQRIAVPPV